MPKHSPTIATVLGNLIQKMDLMNITFNKDASSRTFVTKQVDKGLHDDPL